MYGLLMIKSSTAVQIRYGCRSDYRWAINICVDNRIAVARLPVHPGKPALRLTNVSMRLNAVNAYVQKYLS